MLSREGVDEIVWVSFVEDSVATDGSIIRLRSQFTHHPLRMTRIADVAAADFIPSV
jgi:hypothetical protein